MSRPLPPITERAWRTPEELVDLLGLPSLEWVKDRLQPSHRERLPHHRYGNERVFELEDDVPQIKARHAVPGAPVEDVAEEPAPLASVTDLPIDARTAARGRKALGLA